MIRVVVNPGHDGIRDKGARGPTGLREADVVRRVAQAMRGMDEYEFKRQNVFGLWTLLFALRRNPADVVVSLHCDAGSTDLHEARMFWWRDDPDLDRAERSHQLARSLRDYAMYSQSALVLTAPYMRGRRRFTPGVLCGTSTEAAIIAELGFISDPHVEAAMRTRHWVERAANGVHLGIYAWLRSMGVTK